jgi:plasmid stabilization system protein ParE
MKYTLIFASTAIETYDAVKEQIAGRWGDKVVSDFEQKTVSVLELIESSPLIFQSVESNQNIRKGFIHKNCSVFYEVRGTSIEVLFFWDNRQEPLIR